MRAVAFFKREIFKSLQMRLVFIITVFMLLPVLYFLNYNFSTAEHLLQEKTSNLILDSLQQVGNQIENTCLDIIKISNVLANDRIILAELSTGLLAEGDHQQKRNYYELSSADKIRMIKIEAQLDQIKTGIFYNYDADVLLIDATGVVYSAMGREEEFRYKTQIMENYHEQAWYRSLIQENQNIVWLAPFRYSLFGIDDDSRYISAVRVLPGGYHQRNLGCIMVNVHESQFAPILENHLNGIVALLNEKREIIFSTADRGVIAKVNLPALLQHSAGKEKGYLLTDVDNTRFVVNHYSLNRFGWTLVSIIPYSEMIKEISSLKQRIFSLNLFSSFFLFTVAVVFILYLTNPLKTLVERIKRMKIGEHYIKWPEGDFPDDVSGIVRSFDCLFEKIEELVEVVIEEKRKEQELKYEALRAQITPHFLFNTLNTIKWSAVMSGADNVARMIAALGKLLEVSMSKGEEEVPLREELQLIESYVFIQNVRYNDKYVLKIEAEEGIDQLKVPKLILQPLVENAIIHGLKNIEGKGVITIQARKMDGYLKVSVVDNGAGIPEEKIWQILYDALGEGRKQKFSGIGLSNVHERLKLRYGERFGINLSSQVGSGTTVDLMLPIIT